MPQSQLAQLPSVDKLLLTEQALELIAAYGRGPLLSGLRNTLEEFRQALKDGQTTTAPTAGDILQRTALDLEQWAAPSPRAVHNLTGTVLHTNLGRALMPQRAAAAMIDAATQPVALEFDLTTGKRGDRDQHVSELLCQLTGAEAAIVVNNNAAAVMVILNTLALRKEVPVSRGELVEIGGAFRIPQLMARAGCKLTEVGTTNRTHYSDYRDAINSKTALLMKVHTSNYRIEGFTAAVSERELADLARQHHLPLVTDLGSGSIIDLSQYGLPAEPSPRQMLAAGADLVSFSGDKLLGGPQAGIIVGSRELIERIKRNPMTRALRVDKGRLAALRVILQLAADPARAVKEIPTLVHLTRPLTAIEPSVHKLLPHFSQFAGAGFSSQLVKVDSRIGSGSLPGESLHSAAIALTPTGAKRQRGRSLKQLSNAFRQLPVPVIGRIFEGQLLFDLRCLENESQLIEQLNASGSSNTSTGNH